MSKTSYGSIDLLKLKNAFVKKMKGQSGEFECLIIPLSFNGLTVADLQNGKKAVYMPIAIVENDQADKYGNHGFVKKNAPKSETPYNQMSDAEKERVKELSPILGNFKTFSNNNPAPASNNYAAQPQSFPAVPMSEGDDDDLPF